MRLKKYAVTLSNEKIVYPVASSEAKAKEKVEKALQEKGIQLTIVSVRVV
ncbi:hypothetical protein [Streptomyces lasalocidi]|nr:hypothetical protein [Streptomyces lasalocidi]